MQKFKTVSSRVGLFAVVLVVSTFASAGAFADPIDELKACARIADQEKRYACFDVLGEKVLLEESAVERSVPELAAPSAAPPATIEASAPPPPDDLGKVKFGNEQESGSIEYRGMITSCKKGVYGDWYFTFDNGQVWKDVSSWDRRLKDCYFSATITKDLIGFKMKIAAFEKPIRIRRYR